MNAHVLKLSNAIIIRCDCFYNTSTNPSSKNKKAL